LPQYLNEYSSLIHAIPNTSTVNLSVQIKELKRWLGPQQQRTHYIFSGGWQYACLKHTVNTVVTRVPQFKLNPNFFSGVEDGLFNQYSFPKRDITIEIDWPLVFLFYPPLLITAI